MRKNERYYYPAVFTYEDGQEISVFFPDFDVATSGTDDMDASRSAKECLGCVLCGLEDDGEPFPAPTRLCDIKTADNECVCLIDIYLPSVRSAQRNKCVTRSVTIPAWLNAAALETGVNFSQVLKDALISILPNEQKKNAL